MPNIAQELHRLATSAVRPIIGKRSRKAGLPPGTLVHIGEKLQDVVNVHVIRYNGEDVEEIAVEDTDQLASHRRDGSVTWINVNGLHDTDEVARIASQFGVHPLVQEDIVNTGQRPKMEDFDDYVFIVAKMLHYDARQYDVRIEQVSLVIGTDFVLSFQEFEGDVFDPIRQRLRAGKGRIRKQGGDYLAYALIDALVDHYFVVVEGIGERLELLEDVLISQPSEDVLRAINTLKRDLIFLRRSIWPMREVISALQRENPAVIRQDTMLYLRDVYDHTIHVAEIIETFRDIVAGMLDIYLSSLSNRMNEVIKFLTIIGTIFIPLTFIVGIYGMNFVFMPELEWRYGYFAVLLFMLIVSLGMLGYFRRKGWI